MKCSPHGGVGPHRFCGVPMWKLVLPDLFSHTIRLNLLRGIVGAQEQRDWNGFRISSRKNEGDGHPIPDVVHEGDFLWMLSECWIFRCLFDVFKILFRPFPNVSDV